MHRCGSTVVATTAGRIEAYRAEMNFLSTVHVIVAKIANELAVRHLIHELVAMRASTGVEGQLATDHIQNPDKTKQRYQNNPVPKKTAQNKPLPKQTNQHTRTKKHGTTKIRYQQTTVPTKPGTKQYLVPKKNGTNKKTVPTKPAFICAAVNLSAWWPQSLHFAETIEKLISGR